MNEIYTVVPNLYRDLLDGRFIAPNVVGRPSKAPGCIDEDPNQPIAGRLSRAAEQASHTVVKGRLKEVLMKDRP